MSAHVLEQLKSDEFMLSIGFVSTASALRRALGRKREIRDVRNALDCGEIREETIRRFVSGLLADFHRGRQFLHELPLAALAVALETRPTDFAGEFLYDLSRLRVAEMSLCTRVARECLKRRASMARDKAKMLTMFDLGQLPVGFPSASRTPFSHSVAELSRTTVVWGPKDAKI